MDNWKDPKTLKGLDEVRQEIDRVDDRLKEMFLKRMELVDRVAEIKSGSRNAVYQPGRETAMIERLTEGVDTRFVEEYAEFLRQILRLSKEYQTKKRESHPCG